ncbi:MAG TPA: DUF456 domain-containing protein [Anaerolineae bacterium]|nr:DUF456 domain-containing protein [Anaerolineae bacterium]HQK15766.1 DUF456 domain-containing protein [Anaerolineae bacterium]
MMTHWLEIVVKLLMLFGMFVGLAGMVVPVFPGVTVIWTLALLYGIIFGFGGSGVWVFIVITILAIIGWVVDNILMGGKARISGARWTSITLAFVAGFVGSLFLTPIGGIGATLLTLFLAENAYRKNRREAWEVTKAMAIGWGWSFVARFSIGVVMIGLWAIWAW